MELFSFIVALTVQMVHHWVVSWCLGIGACLTKIEEIFKSIIIPLSSSEKSKGVIPFCFRFIFSGGQRDSGNKVLGLPMTYAEHSMVLIM